MMVESADSTNWEAALQTASQSDVIIAAMGENPALCGEARLRSGIKLPGEQEKFVKQLIATGRPVVLIMFGGRPLIINDIAEGCAAIMHAWYPGEEGGNAIADLLYGNANPSGKISITFPTEETEKNFCYNYGNNNKNFVAYPFGYGLSYNTYEYSDLKMETCKASTSTPNIKFSFTVKNTGKYKGTEIAQVYLSPKEGENLKPIQLKAFERVCLNPGESKVVNIELHTDQLAYYKDRLWQVSPGNYEVKIGASSQDLRLSSCFELTGKTTQKKFRKELFAKTSAK